MSWPSFVCIDLSDWTIFFYSMCSCLCVCVCVPACMRVCAYVCMCMYVCVYMCMQPENCVCVRMHACVCCFLLSCFVFFPPLRFPFTVKFSDQRFYLLYLQAAEPQQVRALQWTGWVKTCTGQTMLSTASLWPA